VFSGWPSQGTRPRGRPTPWSPSCEPASTRARSASGCATRSTSWPRPIPRTGRFLAGALPLEQFKALVDEELAKARDRVKNGTRRKDYYDTWVVKRGLTQLAPPSADPATP